MDIEKLLGNIGLKCTRQRRDILNILRNAPQPMSVEEIYRGVENMSLSTVYRAMELFCEKGIVQSETIRNSGELYYSLRDQRHCHYAICLGCNEIRYVDVCPVHEHGLDINGFQITGHKLELYGYCNKCSEAI